MLQMLNDIEDGSLRVLTQETVVDGCLRHTTLGSKGSHLVVSEIARMVAEGSG